jgi:hypothetical protein
MIDLHKQDYRELGEYLSLSRKYAGIDHEEIWKVFQYKRDESEATRLAKQQSKLDAFHSELEKLFNQGYYKGSILNKVCVSLFGKNGIESKPLDLVLTGKVICFYNSVGQHEPMFCYYREDDPLKRENVMGLGLGPVLSVKTVEPAKYNFSDIIANAKGCQYFLE